MDCAGTYCFTVTITGTNSITSSVWFTVEQIPQVSPGLSIISTSATVAAGGTEQFKASGEDQFGNALLAPFITWTASGGGTIDNTGLYTAPGVAGSATITAHLLEQNGSEINSSPVTVTVTTEQPTVATPAAAAQVPATDTISLSVLGSDPDPAGEANLTYHWQVIGLPSSTASVDFATNYADHTNAAKNAIVTVTELGCYVFQVTITNGSGPPCPSITTTASIDVVQTLTTIGIGPVEPSPPSIDVGQADRTEEFGATGYDQFGAPMTDQPAFTWDATAGSIDDTGLYTAPGVCMPATVTAEADSDGTTVTGSVLVNLTDSSPTTSARLGDSWLESNWELSIGSPNATGQLHYDQATGVAPVRLSATGPVRDSWSARNRRSYWRIQPPFLSTQSRRVRPRPHTRGLLMARLTWRQRPIRQR